MKMEEVYRLVKNFNKISTRKITELKIRHSEQGWFIYYKFKNINYKMDKKHFRRWIKKTFYNDVFYDGENIGWKIENI